MTDVKRAAFVLVGAFLMAIILLASVIAMAHEAPTGWKYDQSCCSDQDCSIVKSVKHNDDGTMEVTGTVDGTDYTVHIDLAEMNKASPWKIKPSKDEYMHICIYVKAGPPTPVCIYLPAGT